jgi:hypothetical protein
MKALKRQVSCVEFDPSVLLEPKENINIENKNCTITNGNDNINLPPLSPFIDNNGQALGRQSKPHK